MDEAASILQHSNIVNVSTAVVIKDQGRYLLIQETEIRDGQEVKLWNFPSGKVNFKENLLEAAKREVLEETGLSVTLTGLISVYYYTTRKNSFDRQNDRLTIRFNFAGAIDASVPAVDPQEPIQTTWLEPTAIQTLLEEKTLRNWIAQRLAQEALTSEVKPLDTIFTARKS